MTNPQFETPERQQAAQLKALYSATIEELRANKDLTPAARRQRILDLAQEGQQRLAKLREADHARLDGEYQGHLRDLFSGARRPWQATGADDISIRDAADRAAAAKTPAQAADLLKQAWDSGDRVLEAAVGKVAADRNGDGPTGQGWGEVLLAYVDANPSHRRPLVERLGQLEDLTGPGGVLGDEFSFRAPREARGPQPVAEDRGDHADLDRFYS